MEHDGEVHVFQAKDNVVLLLASAKDWISSHYNIAHQPEIQGQALIGIAQLGPTVYIALVTDSQPVARILNRHTIYQVKGVHFFTITLPFCRRLATKEVRRISRIRDFPIANYHFWCPTHDITKPAFLGGRRNDSFIWNRAWVRPFAAVGQADVCIDLLQGAIASEVLETPAEPLKLTIITLRESEFGGTRYNSRGLNEEGYAANEVQCELLIESNSGRIWSHYFRRGTVPVTWRSVVSRNLPTVSILVDADFSRGTATYFRRLTDCFPGTVHCVNLMHSQPPNSEAPLSRAYAEAVAPIQRVAYSEFDWHGRVKELGISGAVTELLSAVGGPDVSYSEPGSPFPVQSGGDKMFANELDLPANNPRFLRIQRSILRFNCLDSLDRTSVACFYYSCFVVSQVLAELDVFRRLETYSQLMQMPENIRRFMSAAFVQAGDNISGIYTNMVACMTDNFAAVANTDSKAPSDGSIAVQRRFHNFVTDRRRQKDICLFLGAADSVLPGIECFLCRRLLSASPAVVVDPIYTTPTVVDGTALLQFSRVTLTTTPPSTLLILLNSYAYLSDIVIVLSPPYSPSACSISTALTHGPRVPLVSRVILPQVRVPTPVLLRVPPDYANFSCFLARYICIEFETPHRFVTLSNVFVYGTTEKPFAEYPESFQDIGCRVGGDSRFGGADTTAPDVVLRTLKTVDYGAVIRLEVARLFHGVGRLECMSRLLAARFDPLEFNLLRQRVALSETGIAVVRPEKCCRCDDSSRWKCFKCHRPYCGRCSVKNKIKETFYYECPSLICDGCLVEYSAIANSVDNLRRLYDCFYRLIDPREGITNDWVLADRHIAGLHTLFPKAFFSNIDDPSLNMVLTHEGGAAKAPLSLALSLGTVMRISVIEIDGSPDCAVVIGLQAPIADMFQVSAGSKCECNFTGRFLSLVVQAGTLARLRIVGLPIPQEKITATIDLKRLPDPKKIPCRRVPVAAKRQVFLDVGKERPIQGIVFRDCIGVRSVLLAFFAITWVNPQEKPVAVEYGFLPDCQESEFVMRFRSPVTAKMVQIQFYDVLQRYLDPKIELF